MPRQHTPQPAALTYLQLHGSVFLWGFTAILGELIDMPRIWLVFWRMGLATVGFFLIAKYFRLALRLPLRDIAKLGFVGFVLGVHWIFFFQSIRLANVPVALVVLSSQTFMTALLEPLFTKRRVERIEFVLAGMTVLGIYIIHEIDFQYLDGILAALLSAFLAALYSVMNKVLVDDENAHDPIVINFYQIGVGWGLLALLGVIVSTFFRPEDAFELPTLPEWGWFALMAFLYTNLAYIASLRALRHVTAFNYVLAVNLEPIYAILLAWLFFGESEQLNAQFVLGASLVLGSVFLYPVLRRLKPLKRLW